MAVFSRTATGASPAPSAESMRGACGAREPLKPPGDSLEIQLKAVWEEILAVAPIGVSDNFFALGGDFSKAERVAAKVEEIRGRHLSPSLVVEEGTIEKLARAIHRLDMEPHDRTVVPVQLKGDRAPLYFVSGLGGRVAGLSYLAQYMAKDRPLYGLQAPGLRDSEEALTSVEEIARFYIEAIQSAHGETPVFLAGYSFGGLVAFEMARQLHAAGKPMGLVVMLDSTAPGEQRLTLRNFIRNLPHRLANFVADRSLGQVFAGALRKIALLSLSVVIGGFGPTGIDTPKPNFEDEVEMPADLPDRYRRVLAAHHKALHSYHPGVYPGKITLFRTSSQPLFRAYGRDNGWGRLARGGVDVHLMSGDHMSFMEEPHVRLLARKLEVELRSAGEKSVRLR